MNTVKTTMTTTFSRSPSPAGPSVLSSSSKQQTYLFSRDKNFTHNQVFYMYIV
jgi:hypothetical protein